MLELERKGVLDVLLLHHHCMIILVTENRLGDESSVELATAAPLSSDCSDDGKLGVKIINQSACL